MSRSTRCQCCGHTPNRGSQEACPGGCFCHSRLPIHTAHGPTPVHRQPSKATGQLCPLVVRERHRGVARHAPVSRTRIGWYKTGAGL